MGKANLIKRSNELIDWLKHVRRTLHQFPELSFQERKTAGFVENELRAMGNVEVLTGKETGVDTGVIGRISSGEGPSIAIRADMDALPIQEENQYPYSSKHDGVMHACGHDAHTTIGLGIAKIFSELFKESELTGTVTFIFQPAEEDTSSEGLTGAPYMIQAGVLKNIDAVIGLHMDPELPVGEVKLHQGYSMASNDSFQAKILGTGGHAAYPETGSDPVWMLSFLLQSLYSISSRKVSALEPSIVSVTNVETVPSYNVIPSTVTVRGTIRSYSESNRGELQAKVKEAFSIVKALGGDVELNMIHGEPALYNHPNAIEWLQQTISDILPDFHIHNIPYGMGSEDFSHMLNEIPGAMFFLGASLEDGEERGLHTPKFDIDETSLVNGVAIMATTALRYLEGDYSFTNSERKGDQDGT